MTARFSVHIEYDPQNMALSRTRYEARENFGLVDRVPVLFCLVRRYFLPLLNCGFDEFLKDVETHYELQLRYNKYRIENIVEDFCLDDAVTVYPFFENVVNASGMGGHIHWSDTETPRAIPILRNVEDIDRIPVPEPTSGLWGRRLQWWLRMKELADETEVFFNGKRGRVEVAPLDIGGEGPHTTAIDLAGNNFYWWMLEYPQACHRLLDKITSGLIQAARLFRQVDPRPRQVYGTAEDSAQIMSAEQFKRFTVPYDLRLYETFGVGLKNGRGMHMCGDSTHLHRVLIEDLKITSFDLFGYPVKPAVAARNLGGKVLLWGNINPMLMLNGTKEEVKAAARECLEALAPCGGLLLGDGANVCPGTPLENLAALTEAAEEYGLPADYGRH
jgi:uroporphyrinogen-III decarboxylase